MISQIAKMITQIKAKEITQIRREKQTNGDPLTQRIIGCCFQVHGRLGPGFPEKIYQSALIRSMGAAGLAVEREQRFEVMFDEAPVGEFRVDLLVEGQVILEVKAVNGPMPRLFAAQVLAYLKAAQLPVGLLINFGNTSCEVKRFALSSAKSSSKSAKSK